MVPVETTLPEGFVPAEVVFSSSAPMVAAPKKKRVGKTGRIARKVFPEARTLDTSRGKFSPLPWVYRRVQWYFAPRTWQVLCYLILRVGPDCVTWFSDSEIAVDLGVGHRKIRPHITALKRDGFIDVRDHDGRRYICVLDPLPALLGLISAGKIGGERLARLQEDFDAIGLPITSEEAPMLGSGSETKKEDPTQAGSS